MNVKTAVQPGNTYDVTNHYITREDHPCFGTRRCTVTRVNSAAFYLADDAGESRIGWPKSDRYAVEDDGTVRLTGGGVAQAPTDPWLTLTPVN